MVYYNNEYDGDMSNIDWNAMWYILIMNTHYISKVDGNEIFKIVVAQSKDSDHSFFLVDFHVFCFH